MSIQNEPDARDLRYLKLISGRASGLSDVEIAQQVGGAASPQELYERIKEDGHPMCPKCGTTYVDDTHCEAPGEIPGKRGRRQARSSGLSQELPSAAGAAPLFREKLQELIQATEDLKQRFEPARRLSYFFTICRRKVRRRIGPALSPGLFDSYLTVTRL